MSARITTLLLLSLVLIPVVSTSADQTVQPRQGDGISLISVNSECDRVYCGGTSFLVCGGTAESREKQAESICTAPASS
jgi:hypothetical protein